MNQTQKLSGHAPMDVSGWLTVFAHVYEHRPVGLETNVIALLAHCTSLAASPAGSSCPTVQPPIRARAA